MYLENTLRQQIAIGYYIKYKSTVTLFQRRLSYEQHIQRRNQKALFLSFRKRHTFYVRSLTSKLAIRLVPRINKFDSILF